MSSFKIRRLQKRQSSFFRNISMKSLVFGGGGGETDNDRDFDDDEEEELLAEEEALAHFWNDLVADTSEAEGEDYDDFIEAPVIVEGENEVDVDDLQEQYNIRNAQEQPPRRSTGGKKSLVPHVPRRRTSAAVSVASGRSLRSQLSRHFSASSQMLAKSGRMLSMHSILTSAKGSAKFGGGASKSELLAARGSLDEQRDAAIGAIFDRLDLDGDGVLDKVELEAMLLDAAATIKLTVDESIIDAAIEALIEDATGEEAQQSVEASYMVGDYNTAQKNNKLASIDNEGINKAQFSDIFKRNPDMLRAFMSQESKRNLSRERTKKDIQEEQEENEQVWKTTWKNWKITLFWLTIYIAANVVSFTLKAVKYANHDEAQAVFGNCVVAARGAAQCLNLNCALILIPMARHFITRIRATQARFYFPFDHVLDIHMLLGGAILFWTCVHVGAHVCDFHRLASHATEEEIQTCLETNWEKMSLMMLGIDGLLR